LAGAEEPTSKTLLDLLSQYAVCRDTTAPAQVLLPVETRLRLPSNPSQPRLTGRASVAGSVHLDLPQQFAPGLARWLRVQVSD
jgi:hypothetical protein